MPVHFSMREGAAVLEIDNPPLNLLSREIRGELQSGINGARRNNAPRLIITGCGKFFVAGADAREFGAPPQEPHLNELLAELAAFPVPTIAAINGPALGGGLEIALACRYRIASPEAKLGLPEVQLGIIPGAGGTQRLPRVAGIAAALDIIVAGKTVTGSGAVEAGLVDRIEADPLAAALAIDNAVLSTATVADLRPAPQPDVQAVEAMRAHVGRRMSGQIGPRVAIELIEASATGGLANALDRERKAFLELRASGQARALRHLFFAERAALNRGREFPPAGAIESVIIVGGGTMGAGIAYAVASTGISVVVVERNAAAREQAAAKLAELVKQGIDRGTLTHDAGVQIGGRMSTTIGYGDLPHADLAIEAAFEDLDVKRQIFEELERVLPATTILATNTSYLDVNILAEAVADPGRVVGLHFFSPAHIMKLLEIVRGGQTSSRTLAAAFYLARRLGKMPVLSGVCDGFIGNRILASYRHAADILLAEGALPQEVDAAMRSFGMAMGPYETQDLSGLDIGYANRKRLKLAARTDRRYVPLIERLVEYHGRLGRTKSGSGWYDYAADGKAVPSDIVTGEVIRVSEEAGLQRKGFTSEDIVDRITTAMASEAIAILDEGIAEKPQDIDLVLVHGYGFPRWRGGPMHFADQVGTDRLLARIEAFAAEDSLTWRVPPLLRRLVTENRTIDSLNSGT